jgi:hypothetical protein
MKPLKGKWIEYSDLSSFNGRTCIFMYVPKKNIWDWLTKIETDSAHILQITLRFQFQRDWSQCFKACEVREFWPKSTALTIDEKKLAINEFLAQFPSYAEYVSQTTLVL